MCFAFPCSALRSWALLRAFSRARRTAQLLLHLQCPPGSGSPILVPPEKQLLALGAVALAEKCPRTHGQNRRTAMTLNRLTLIGFVGADAEAKANSNGSPYTVFSVATKTSWKNADGTWDSRTEW